jgi:hypothetical protein
MKMIDFEEYAKKLCPLGEDSIKELNPKENLETALRMLKDGFNSKEKGSINPLILFEEEIKRLDDKKNNEQQIYDEDIDLHPFYVDGWNMPINGENIIQTPVLLFYGEKVRLAIYSKYGLLTPQDIHNKLSWKALLLMLDGMTNCFYYHWLIEQQKELLTPKPIEPDIPLLQAKSIGQKCMLLNELGIIDFLITKHQLSPSKIGELFEVLTGDKSHSISSSICSFRKENKNDPYKIETNNTWVQHQLESLKIKRE